MLAVGTATLVAAASRLRSGDVDVTATPLLVVGVLGLMVNAVAIRALHQGAAVSLNVRGAYLEVVADAAGSVGVIVAAALIAITGDGVWDTVLAVAIGGFVVVRAGSLGRSVWSVFAQHAPHGVDAAAVEGDLSQLTDVAGVHDLHLWTLTSGMDVATVHLVTTEGADTHRLLHAARTLLRERHHLAHATVQIESCDRTGCAEMTW
ncbi:MAG: cation diffusion facilitator family transporter [Ilumatobacteraceae bacterium]